MTASEREMLAKRDDLLTQGERMIISQALDDLAFRARTEGIPVRNDDTLAKLEAAFIRYLLDCKGVDTSVVYHGYPALDIDKRLWQDRPMHIRAKNERRVVYALLTKVLEAGFTIDNVYDGEERTKATTVKDAMELIFNLDTSYVWVKKEGFRPHYMLFVLGNADDGSEALADWSYSEDDLDGFNALLSGFDSSTVV